MPRYELADASEKFWEYVVLETRLFTCYGSSDSKGKVAIKDFDCPAKARKDANKRKKEKLAQGYKIVSEKRTKARTEKRNPDLEAVLLDKPDDADGYAVYSDWLQTEGEPRGEIIALHNAVHENPEDKHLQMHLARIMYAARAQMFPPLLNKELDKARKEVAPDEHCQTTWANGFIRSARIGGILENGNPSAADIIDELLAHNSGRFVSELRVATLRADKRQPYTDVIKTLISAGVHLRALYLAEVPDEELAGVDLGDLRALFAALPKLQTLHLGAASLELHDVELAGLQELSLSSPAIGTTTLQAVVNGPWPALSHLSIDFHHQDVDWNILAPVFDGAAPKLRALTLSRTKDTAIIWKALCRSKCLAQLSELSVVDGDLEDLALSLETVDLLVHLESLNLDRHHLSGAMVEDLGSKATGTVTAIHQRPKGARAVLTEAHVQALTSADNFKRGRALAKPAKWGALGKQGDLLWGEFQGSSFYQAFVSFGENDEMDSACTCPSQFLPCKHILGLLLIEVQQHAFPDQPPPAGLLENAENERYASVYE
jgi:uncharacterized protein (TIGR02996 family)